MRRAYGLPLRFASIVRWITTADSSKWQSYQWFAMAAAQLMSASSRLAAVPTAPVAPLDSARLPSCRSQSGCRTDLSAVVVPLADYAEDTDSSAACRP